MTAPETQIGESAVARERLVLAIEATIPRDVTVWEAPYSRRFGSLDRHDRQTIAERAADAALAHIGGQRCPNGHDAVAADGYCYECHPIDGGTANGGGEV